MNDKPIIPDEKAQIVIAGQGVGNIVVRFKTVKNAEKVYKAAMKAWADKKIFEFTGDNVILTVDMSQVFSCTFADTAKFMKFVAHPYQ